MVGIRDWTEETKDRERLNYYCSIKASSGVSLVSSILRIYSIRICYDFAPPIAKNTAVVELKQTKETKPNKGKHKEAMADNSGCASDDTTRKVSKREKI